MLLRLQPDTRLVRMIIFCTAPLKVLWLQQEQHSGSERCCAHREPVRLTIFCKTALEALWLQ